MIFKWNAGKTAYGVILYLPDRREITVFIRHIIPIKIHYTNNYEIYPYPFPF